MSRGATLSVLGLYNQDPSIFDLMAFPEGFTDAQKKTVTDNILVETAELEVLYASPAVMKNVIGIWSYKELPYWNRIYKASLLEYNPIENYRRNEEEQIADTRKEEHSGSDINRESGSDSLARTGTDTTTESGNDTMTRTGTETTAETGTETLAKTGTIVTEGESTGTEGHSGNDRVDHNVAGYDSNLLVPRDEDETTYGHDIDTSTEGTTTVTNDTLDTTTFGKTDTLTLNTQDRQTYGKSTALKHDSTDTTVFGKTAEMEHGENIDHEGNTDRHMIAFGNIGVTTSQEMLTQEIEIAKIINVIPVIIESFIDRFCLLVY